ncbi:MAG: ATP-binding protein [Proteobacteria bacterium]|nr:ATP-binding protein [Pseudomonadota bacterium]
MQHAEASSQAKSAFLSSMSHELRTPMNAILGFGQILEMDMRVRNDPKEITAIENILRAGEHLLDLINQVLELNALDEAEIAVSISNVPLSAPLQECMELMRTTATEKQIQILGPDFTKPLPTVKADRLRLKQVLFNLVSNAIKYNREDGSVTLRCQPIEDNTVRITVSDTGSGISSDQRDLIFVPFERLGRESGVIEGTGIGLAICKNLIEAMGGHLAFDSTEGVGSSFYFNLPRGDVPDNGASDLVANVTAGEMKADVEPESAASSARENMELPPSSVEPDNGLVLYVEDNSQSLNLMEMIFKQINGVDLISAPNGEMGLAIARDRQPGLILMDIDLPGMDGIECFRRLRENDETKSIPVIAVSAGAMPEEIRKITRAGFDDYLCKPVVVATLVKKVTDHFEKDKPATP